VGNPDHKHQLALIVDRIDDPMMVADSNSEVVTAGQPRNSWWAWLLTEPIDGSLDPLAETTMQPFVGLNCSRMRSTSSL
jgi:hypothetical protein